MQFTWDEIRKLSIAERIQLVEDIWDSIAQDNAKLAVPESHKREIDRRWAEYGKDPTSFSWSQVREELDQEP
jgi:putative addiction module component (TIGR02574 family)